MGRRLSINSGSSTLDKIMGGGLKENEIAHLYGPSGVGKTTLALQFAISVARTSHRVYYVNPEGRFPIIRLQQLAPTDFDDITPFISVLTPTTFVEQSNLISQLDTIIKDKGRLLIFDTIVSLYRKELGNFGENITLNRRLNQQLGIIANFVLSHPIAAILINQVRSDITEPGSIKPVADTIISYWCNYSIEITRAESKGYRELKFKKREKEKALEIILKLENSGLR